MNQIIQSLKEYSKITSSSTSKFVRPEFIQATGNKILTNPSTCSSSDYFIVARIDCGNPGASKDIDDFIDELINADPVIKEELAIGRKWVAESLYGDTPDTLKKLRLRAGLSQAELAEKIGMKQPNVSEMECGKRSPSIETIERIAIALDVSLETVRQATR